MGTPRTTGHRRSLRSRRCRRCRPAWTPPCCSRSSSGPTTQSAPTIFEKRRPRPESTGATREPELRQTTRRRGSAPCRERAEGAPEAAHINNVMRCGHRCDRCLEKQASLDHLEKQALAPSLNSVCSAPAPSADAESRRMELSTGAWTRSAVHPADMMRSRCVRFAGGDLAQQRHTPTLFILYSYRRDVPSTVTLGVLVQIATFSLVTCHSASNTFANASLSYPRWQKQRVGLDKRWNHE